MVVLWEQNGNAYHASGTLEPDETPIRLIVEPIPHGRWGWAVWRLNDHVKLVGSGGMDTVQEAMRAAQEAAR